MSLQTRPATIQSRHGISTSQNSQWKHGTMWDTLQGMSVIPWKYGRSQLAPRIILWTRTNLKFSWKRIVLKTVKTFQPFVIFNVERSTLWYLNGILSSRDIEQVSCSLLIWLISRFNLVLKLKLKLLKQSEISSLVETELRFEHKNSRTVAELSN